MPDNPISQTEWTLVQRYLIGPVTPAETDAAQAVVQREPRLQALVDVLRTTAPVTGSPTADLGSLKRRIDATRMTAPSSAMRLRGFKAQPLRRTTWSMITALVTVAILIITSWKLGGMRAVGHEGTTESTYTTYTTANGQRATITLPDGNTVSLNVASRLEVPTNYRTGNHMVRLPVGEALFTVSHHTGAPFTVITGATTARVLGTSFVIRRYLTDTTASVTVEEGKVAVGAVVVTAHHMVEFSANGVPHVQRADSSQFAFATGILSVPVTSLSAAIPELNRWYDADIRLGDPSLASQRFQGKFTPGSLADLGTLLKMTFDVRVVRDGRVLTLYPKSR